MDNTEFVVLYTHQKTKKSKTWQDGILKASLGGSKAVLYDEGKKSKMDSFHIKPEQIVVGEEIESDRFLILIEDRVKTSQTESGQCDTSSGSQRTCVIDMQQVSTHGASGKGKTVRAATQLQGLRIGLKRRKTGFVPPRQVRPRIDPEQNPEDEHDSHPTDSVSRYDTSSKLSLNSLCHPKLNLFNMYKNSDNRGASDDENKSLPGSQLFSNKVVHTLLGQESLSTSSVIEEKKTPLTSLTSERVSCMFGTGIANEGSLYKTCGQHNFSNRLQYASSDTDADGKDEETCAVSQNVSRGYRTHTALDTGKRSTGEILALIGGNTLNKIKYSCQTSEKVIPDSRTNIQNSPCIKKIEDRTCSQVFPESGEKCKENAQLKRSIFHNHVELCSSMSVVAKPEMNDQHDETQLRGQCVQTSSLHHDSLFGGPNSKIDLENSPVLSLPSGESSEQNGIKYTITSAESADTLTSSSVVNSSPLHVSAEEVVCEKSITSVHLADKSYPAIMSEKILEEKAQYSLPPNKDDFDNTISVFTENHVCSLRTTKDEKLQSESQTASSENESQYSNNLSPLVETHNKDEELKLCVRTASEHAIKETSDILLQDENLEYNCRISDQKADCQYVSSIVNELKNSPKSRKLKDIDNVHDNNDYASYGTKIQLSSKTQPYTQVPLSSQNDCGDFNITFSPLSTISQSESEDEITTIDNHSSKNKQLLNLKDDDAIETDIISSHNDYELTTVIGLSKQTVKGQQKDDTSSDCMRNKIVTGRNNLLLSHYSNIEKESASEVDTKNINFESSVQGNLSDCTKRQNSLAQLSSSALTSNHIQEKHSDQNEVDADTLWKNKRCANDISNISLESEINSEIGTLDTELNISHSVQPVLEVIDGCEKLPSDNLWISDDSFDAMVDGGFIPDVIFTPDDGNPNPSPKFRPYTSDIHNSNDYPGSEKQIVQSQSSTNSLQDTSGSRDILGYYKNSSSAVESINCNNRLSKLDFSPDNVLHISPKLKGYEKGSFKIIEKDTRSKIENSVMDVCDSISENDDPKGIDELQNITGGNNSNTAASIPNNSSPSELVTSSVEHNAPDDSESQTFSSGMTTDTMDTLSQESSNILLTNNCRPNSNICANFLDHKRAYRVESVSLKIGQNIVPVLKDTPKGNDVATDSYCRWEPLGRRDLIHLPKPGNDEEPTLIKQEFVTKVFSPAPIQSIPDRGVSRMAADLAQSPLHNKLPHPSQLVRSSVIDQKHCTEKEFPDLVSEVNSKLEGYQLKGTKSSSVVKREPSSEFQGDDSRNWSHLGSQGGNQTVFPDSQSPTGLSPINNEEVSLYYVDSTERKIRRFDHDKQFFVEPQDFLQAGVSGECKPTNQPSPVQQVPGMEEERRSSPFHLTHLATGSDINEELKCSTRKSIRGNSRKPMKTKPLGDKIVHSSYAKHHIDKSNRKEETITSPELERSAEDSFPSSPLRPVTKNQHVPVWMENSPNDISLNESLLECFHAGTQIKSFSADTDLSMTNSESNVGQPNSHSYRLRMGSNFNVPDPTSPYHSKQKRSASYFLKTSPEKDFLTPKLHYGQSPGAAQCESKWARFQESLQHLKPGVDHLHPVPNDDVIQMHLNSDSCSEGSSDIFLSQTSNVSGEDQIKSPTFSLDTAELPFRNRLLGRDKSHIYTHTKSDVSRPCTKLNQMTIASNRQKKEAHSEMDLSRRPRNMTFNQTRGFQTPLSNVAVQSTISNSQRNLGGDLMFPDKEEVESNVTPQRQVRIPVDFSNASVYKQVFTAALREHINIQLFEIAKNYHSALAKIDISSYGSADLTAQNTRQNHVTPTSSNPCCEHGLPSKIVQVKKEGQNQGRYFFACSAPRSTQCKFFKWSDEIDKRATSQSSRWHLDSRLVLSDAEAISTFVKGHTVSLYCECQIIRKSADAYRTRTAWTKKKYQFCDQNTKKQLYIRLSRREGSSSYGKDDLWIISKQLTFDRGCTFVAKSVFFGPTVSNDLEIEPMTGFSPSNWPNEILCHAIHAGNAGSELGCIKNLAEFVNTATLPILPHLLNIDNPVEFKIRRSGFSAPMHHAKRTFNTPWDIIETETNYFIKKYHLNMDQGSALGKVALMVNESSTHAISLIHGVFGAGKSFLLAVIVLFLVRLFEKNEEYCSAGVEPLKLLISSTTNVAVDRILLGLLDMKFEEFIRVGSVKKIAKRVLPYSVHATDRDSQELRDLQEMLKSQDLSSSEKILVRKTIEQFRNGENKKKLNKVKVVGVTCAACSFKCLKSMRFAVVLLDECSQMTEPTSLLPIARFECQKLVLVGDPKQLSPTIQGSEAGKNQGLEQTLFDRLTMMGHEATMLRIQYRCHPLISAIVNNLFYDNQLIDGITSEQRSPLAPALPTLCFFDVRNGHEYNERGTSYYNEEEAKFVVSLIEYLVISGVHADEIGVITHYRGQLGRVSHLLSKSSVSDSGELRAIQISTVDAFQGGERGIIILSCVRTHKVGFIDCDKRTNVALTRSKNHLFIVGNRKNLSNNPLWRKVILHCQSSLAGIRNADACLTEWSAKLLEAREQRENKKKRSKKATEKRVRASNLVSEIDIQASL